MVSMCITPKHLTQSYSFGWRSPSFHAPLCSLKCSRPPTLTPWQDLLHPKAIQPNSSCSARKHQQHTQMS
ncbi:hypothetical protein Mapa_005405 [Marchantia paleacea]|nr:hypothetical protein Mapa_005405 [Marchantia paleacea]